MAQAINLFIDTYSGEFVSGTSNAAQGVTPKFIQGDTKQYNIYLLARTQTHPFSNPYTVINNAALSLKVALGPKTGTAGSTLYASQFTWTRDALNQFFTGSLALNTAEIATLIGGAASASAYFEIEFTEAGLPTTVMSKPVVIEAEVIETGSLTVQAGLTAISAEEANAIFLKRDIVGAIYLTNPTTGKKMALYLGDDDGFKAELVT